MRKKKLISNIDPAVYDALVAQAKSQDVSRSRVVNKALANALGVSLKEKSQKNSPEPAGTY